MLFRNRIMNTVFSPSKLAMEQLAKDLVEKYPSFGDARMPSKGFEMWWFHTIHAPVATGFLEERLKNQRRKSAVERKKNKTKDEIICFAGLDWASDNEDGNFINYSRLYD